MEKMQDPKMCWAFPLPGRGVVVAVYPSHALISLQWYGSYPGFKRVILLHCSIIFQVAARQRASDSSFIYPGQSKSSLNYAFAKGLVELGLYNWGFLYVIIFEIIFLWYYAEEDPTPKDIPCLKNWRRTFEICENSDTVKKTLKRQWKTVKTPWKDSEHPQNQVCAKRMVLRFCPHHFSYLLPLYVTAADLMVGKLQTFQFMTESPLVI